MPQLYFLLLIGNSKTLKIKVFAGDSGSFEMYEDDGFSDAYKSGAFAMTRFSFQWGETSILKISNSGADRRVIPGMRTYEIEFIGMEDCDANVICDGVACKTETKYENGVFSLTVETVSEKASIELRNTSLHKNDILTWLDAFLAETASEYLLKEAVYNNLFKMNTMAGRLIYIGQNIEDNNLRLALQEIIMNGEA